MKLYNLLAALSLAKLLVKCHVAAIHQDIFKAGRVEARDLVYLC